MHQIVFLSDSIIAVLKSSMVDSVSSWRMLKQDLECDVELLPDECVFQL